MVYYRFDGLVGSMKEALSSFDVRAVVKELQVFVGGRIDKVYHPTREHLILAVRCPGEGKEFIHFHLGRWLYRSSKGQEFAQQPSDFAMMLRKRIANAKITCIRQQGFERIAVISLEKDDEYDLVLELFAEGNIILVKGGEIVQPLISHTWKHRDVRAKRQFMFPPPVPDPTVISADDLLSILRGSDTDMVRTLATKLNMGGRYSEETCARTGIEKKAVAGSISPEDAGRILATIRGLLSEVDLSAKGRIVLRNNNIEDVVPVDMMIYRGSALEEHESFSAAIESYAPRVPKPQKEKPKEAVLELERLKRKLAQQESAAISLQDEAREAQIMGDFLFANYETVAKALLTAKQRLAESKELTELSGYVSYDPRTSLLTVSVAGAQLRLDIKGSVESNAQRYYEQAKRARKKLVGVIAALDTAKKEIEKGTAETAVRQETRKKHPPTKHFWFERFRWFISSEGAVVLGGKDARTNDMLVKKHLEPGDRYAHADVHGAPSVVVKMKDGITERTLHEACEFAVATSRAWNARIGSAAGYWVLPEQVSKTPQSGEFLARGAFVIRGKRNYSNKIEIKLGVGEVQFEGQKKIMCAPEKAIRANSSRFVMIRPGETDKDLIARKLSDVFEVPIEEIQSILPPGDVEVVEQVDMSIT